MIKNQRGVTLIELMIGMVLGLSLVSGIGSLFIQSQKSFRLQNNVSDMTDDASFILESLAKGLLLAGFADSPSPSLFPEDLDVMSVSGVPTINLSAGEFIHGTDTQLVYRYQLGVSPYAVNTSSELDNFVATGAVSGVTGELVTVRIYKNNDSNGIPVLYSKAETDSDTGNNAEPLVSEVENLQFRYGIRVKCYEHNVSKVCDKTENIALNQYQPTRDTYFYTTASNVDLIDSDTAKNNWQNVFAVKVFVVMRSADTNLTKNKTGWSIEGGATEYPATDEKRLYRVFSKTIFLRVLAQ